MPPEPYAEYRTIRAAREGWAACLVLSRPERRNALTQETMTELADALGRIAADGAVRALVLRGSGGWFSAGGDLGTMGEMPPAPADGAPDPLLPAYRRFGDFMLALNALPVATIALVEGVAAGGGFGMACATDVTILGPGARFAIPEPRAGFIPSQILPFIVRRIGEGAARDLAVTGRTVDAAEALRMGIGQRLCPDAAAAEEELARALDDIARMEPTALAAVKRLVLACATTADSAVLDLAAGELVGLLRRPAAREGMRAFLAKTLPSWASAPAGGASSAARDPGNAAS